MEHGCVKVNERRAQFEQLARRIDPAGRLLYVRNLDGGVSAEVTVFEIERSDGTTTRLLARRHGDRDLARNPDLARDEFRLLKILHARGLATPKPYLVDASCTIFSTPVLVIEFVDGETDFNPGDLHDALFQMATQLAKIHAVPDSPDLAFLPRSGKGVGDPPEVLDESMNEGRIREALESAWPESQSNDSVLLHGDFWPGNILWRDGRLVAVIDWEDACVGDPLVDLGNTRLETLWAFGLDAMRELTDLYRSMTAIDLTNLAYWDLIAALRPCGQLAGWGLDAAAETRMKKQHAAFVDEALARMRPF